MTDPAVIEVKKHAMRQTQEGSWLLTLSLSQEDVPLWLFTAPMGQRMAIAELTIIAEQPQGTDSGPVATSPTGAADSPPPPLILDRLTAGLRNLAPPMLVRIQLQEPNPSAIGMTTRRRSRRGLRANRINSAGGRPDDRQRHDLTVLR